MGKGRGVFGRLPSPGFATRRISKEIARQTAKKIGKEDFLVELRDWWCMVLEERKGAVDKEVELERAMKRIRKSGQEHVFKEVKITREDLEKTLGEAMDMVGKSEKVERMKEAFEKAEKVHA